MTSKITSILSSDATWYKDAIIYEVAIKAFKDTNGDGIGDFKGLIEKLAYLEDLGINAIWLLPFYPSPNKDGGYDISDYFGVSKDYGDIKDFKNFLKEAHARGIRVITELVINHTSDQHPWFQRARKAPKGSNYRNFYVWSETQDKYKEARIIFKDAEISNWTLDSVAGEYFWHRFYSHQPDLNFENPDVHKAILEALDFWLNLGVDGLRLDAIPYLYEEDDTNCENLAKTHEFIKKVRKHVDTFHKDKMLLAEANQWPEDSAKYFGAGDECHMCFHFPLMPRMYMAIEMEDSFPILDIMEQTPEIDETSQWATFLRNHDELTLEMVTDEERDFMYKSFADEPRARINLGIRRRLAPLLKNNRKKFELLHILLFSIKGTPVLYYGDEIGMGDNIYLGDRDGVRTPMQWSSNKNAGFSEANPQKLFLPLIIDPEYHYSVINVENLEANPISVLWWTKKLIDVRRKYKALSRGTIKFLKTNNNKILSYVREYEGEIILIAVNLSKWAEFIKIDLSDYDTYIPVEIFSGHEFPCIDKNEYTLTFGAYEYYCFELTKKDLLTEEFLKIPELKLKDSWKTLFMHETSKHGLSEVFSFYFKKSSYLTKHINNISIIDYISLDEAKYYIVVMKVEYTNCEFEIVQIPISIVNELTDIKESDLIAKLYLSGVNSYIINSINLEDFRNTLLKFLIKKKHIKINLDSVKSVLEEATNNYYLISYNQSYILKFFKKIDKETSNDYEYRLLTKDKNISNEIVLSYFLDGNKLLYLLLKKLDYLYSVKEYFNESLDKYLEYILNLQNKNTDESFKLSLVESKISFSDVLGALEQDFIKQLAKLITEFQITVFGCNNKINLMYQRSLYQTYVSSLKKMFFMLNDSLSKLDDNLIFDIHMLASNKDTILNFPKFLIEEKLDFCKHRYHGELNVNNILFTGKSFFIKNFDGDTSKSVSQRKLEKVFLFDLAFFSTSIILNAYEQLFLSRKIRNIDAKTLNYWVDKWLVSVVSVLSKEYFNILIKNNFISKDADFNSYNKMFFVYLNQNLMDRIVYSLNINNNELLLVTLKVLLGIVNLKKTLS